MSGCRLHIGDAAGKSTMKVAPDGYPPTALAADAAAKAAAEAEAHGCEVTLPAPDRRAALPARLHAPAQPDPVH